MKLRVELKEGKNPRIYDIETGKDMTARVKEIQIMPIRRADALLFKKNSKGSYPYIDEDTHDWALIQVPIERIEGTWVAAEEQLFPPWERGNFDLSAAREALIRLQNERPSSGGCWTDKECELVGDAMEALFPGEEGEALHKQMTERFENKA